MEEEVEERGRRGGRRWWWRWVGRLVHPWRVAEFWRRASVVLARVPAEEVVVAGGLMEMEAVREGKTSAWGLG